MARRKKKKVEKKKVEKLEVQEPTAEVSMPKKRPLESRERKQNRRRSEIRYRNFDEFWFKIKKERNLIDDKYKRPLIAHLKARGFWSPERYEEGLRDFGL